MANTIPTQVRIDAELKDKANEIFKNLGLNMSTAINIFLNQCVINKGFPFMISTVMNSRISELIEEAYEVSNSKTAVGFKNVDKLFEDMGYYE